MAAVFDSGSTSSPSSIPSYDVDLLLLQRNTPVRQRVTQSTKLRLIVTPQCHCRVIDRPTDLRGARGGDGRRVRMKLKAGVLPFQAAECEQLAGFLLWIGNK